VKSALPFLMFQGEAGPALDFYSATFPDAEIVSRTDGEDGKVQRAILSLKGQQVMLFDSPPVHAFTFTPSFSFFIECDDDAELERLATALPEDGQIMMPPGDYGFSRRFAWVSDRFGVSWQLNLT
jgi:predicted 3-demethylubiquinone-9 3-methyltransferase (glyoxalase superfamily)